MAKTDKDPPSELGTTVQKGSREPVARSFDGEPEPDPVRSTPEMVDPTQAATEAASGSLPTPPVNPARLSFPATLMSERYRMKRAIGDGGMGIVELHRDPWIGRNVAIKRAKPERAMDPVARARFIREVRVQGQLEHPGIVPVYDVGEENGAPYFAMKRIRGLTLSEVVQGLRKGVRPVAEQYTLRRLLSAMRQVCLTMAFAHSRGVVHRDLKPSNIMLGDFGEVYVLDWGIARLEDDAPTENEEAAEDLEDATGPGLRPTSSDGLGRTADGLILGTAGYMAPEQVRGETRAVGAGIDIFALGAILYEVLAREPLFKGKSVPELLANTLRTDLDRRPSSIRAEVSPELDAICERATEPSPSERFASARELADAIEDYLDGERDQRHREELAARHVLEASAMLERAGADPVRKERARALALGEVSRALAFDPSNEAARTLLVETLVTAPRELPPEAAAELEETNRKDRARSSRLASVAFALLAMLTPLIVWSGVRSWGSIGILEACVGVIIAYAAWMGVSGKASLRHAVFAIPPVFLACAVLGSFFGPFVWVPSAASTAAAVFLVTLRPDRRVRQLIFASSVLAVIAPWLLRYSGWIDRSHRVVENPDGSTMVAILPRAMHFTEPATSILLIGSSLFVVVVSNVLIGKAAQRLSRAERSVFAQLWRLRQLLPEGARTTAPNSEIARDEMRTRLSKRPPAG